MYAGVKMMRTVAATDDFVLDVFQVASDEEHTYDYLFHTYDDDGAFRVHGELKGMELGKKPPWSWLSNARGMSVGGEWSAAFRQGELRGRFTQCPGRKRGSSRASSRDRRISKKPSVPMLIARRKARSTVFVCLLQAERGELPPARLSMSMATGTV